MHRAAPPRTRVLFALTVAGLVTVSPCVERAGAQVTPWQTSIAASADSQTLPEDRGADGLAQTLKKLHTWASVMMIVAHPDDEDGGMLTFESRGLGARTAMMTLTRGEGGQNAMSGEADDALGLIRTNELLLADEYSGTEQYFSRVADYGFSKTLDEAHQKWGRDRVLYDVVRAVRLYRPLVITAVFTGNITDGHGHHQMSGEAAQEAFLMAGDPNVFPDQIAQGLRPWTPLKVYGRQPFFSITGKGMFDYATNKWAPVRFYDYVQQKWNDKVPSVDVEIPEGTYDPILGRSYVQMSREGWAVQKSQYGGGNPPLPGSFSVSYHRYGSHVQEPAGDAKEQNFFDGIDTSLAGIATLAHGDTAFLTAGLKEIDQHVMTATFGYMPSNPLKIAPELAAGYKRTLALMAEVKASGLSEEDKANVLHELDVKSAQFNTALAEALGLQVRALVLPEDRSKSPNLSLNAEPTRTAVVPGEEFTVRLDVTSAASWTTGGALKLTKTWLASSGSDQPWAVERVVAPGADAVASNDANILYRVTVDHHAPPTQPYFTRPSAEQPYYDIADAKLLNQPFAPYPLAGWAQFDYEGVPIRLGQVVQTIHREHGLGNMFEPLVVMPKLAVNLTAHAGVVPLGAQAFPMTISVKNYQPEKAEGTLRLDLPQGWTVEPAATPFQLGPDASVTVMVTVHPGALAAQSYELRAEAQSDTEVYSTGVQQVGYPGVRPYFLDQPATYQARGVDVKTAPGLSVGYVMGTGDEVPEALKQLGVATHLLTPADLASADLSHYSAIVVGIRAYSNRMDLVANNQRLLDYARNGGVVIVQYQSPGLAGNVGPYPFTVPGDAERVVDETDAVKLLAPGDPLLAWPNRITEGDFSGWEEERGHSFASSWDPHFTALTEVADPGEDPQRGGLLVAQTGKGFYVYEAFALYRQFPAAVPGAYRLMANLISLGANPNRKTP